MSETIQEEKENPFTGMASTQIDKIYEGIDIPRTLFHYTSSAGLLGIIQSGSLWFSDAAYLNDGSETTYAINIVSHSIDILLEGKNDSEKEAGEQLKEKFASLFNHFQPVIFCMSSKDNLLNQWRDYGRDIVPYSIAFDASELEKWQSRSFPIMITKIVYDYRIQLELLSNFLSTIYLKTKEILGEREYFEVDEADRLLTLSSVEILRLVTRFKNGAFEAEDEYRAICYRPDVEKAISRSYRTSSLGVIPYYKWAPKDDNEKLPIIGVTVGPSPYAEISDLALKSFLQDNGYNIETKYSTIPIRR